MHFKVILALWSVKSPSWAWEDCHQGFLHYPVPESGSNPIIHRWCHIYINFAHVGLRVQNSQESISRRHLTRPYLLKLILGHIWNIFLLKALDYYCEYIHIHKICICKFTFERSIIPLWKENKNKDDLIKKKLLSPCIRIPLFSSYI